MTVMINNIFRRCLLTMSIYFFVSLCVHAMKVKFVTKPWLLRSDVYFGAGVHLEPTVWCSLCANRTPLQPGFQSSACAGTHLHHQMRPWFSSTLMPCIGSQEEEENGLPVLVPSNVHNPYRALPHHRVCPRPLPGQHNIYAYTHYGRDNVIPLMKLYPRIIFFDKHLRFFNAWFAHSL